MIDTETAIPPPTAEKIAKIEDSIDRAVLTTLELVPSDGSAPITNYNQLLDISKTMSTAKYGIPAHLRGNPGDCLAIRELALNTGLSPYGLAQHCYIVKDMLCYDAQVIHAIIEKHAPLEARLRFKFTGEGPTRTCTVIGQFRGEVEPCEYTTPELGKITPKNSPLWTSDPDQQLTYFAVRRWGRRYCPDVLLGVYSKDDLEDSEIGPDRARDVTPKLLDRLPGRVEGDGFQPDTVEAAQEEATALARADEIKRNRKAAAKPSKGAKRGKTATPAPSVGASRARQTAKGVAEGRAAPKLAPTTPAATSAAMVKGAEGA